MEKPAVSNVTDLVREVLSNDLISTQQRRHFFKIHDSLPLTTMMSTAR